MEAKGQLQKKTAKLLFISLMIASIVVLGSTVGCALVISPPFLFQEKAE